MPSDPNDTCPHCDEPFWEYEDYPEEEEGDPVTHCQECNMEFHVDCLKRHACPQRVKADQEKLEAWGLACADGRK
jgi:hypothetical protein